MNAEEYHKLKNFRWIADDEIVFDVDDRELGFQAINHIAFNLFNADYGFSIYYAEGQKSPHIHLKILNLDKIITSDVRNKYKELFCLKYCPEKYHKYLDLSFYKKSRSPIAGELKPHFKYGTIKELKISFQKINYIEDLLLHQAHQAQKTIEPKLSNDNDASGHWINNINEHISILNVARSFGLSIKGTKSICPFHSDKNPSLQFYDNEARFYCFGCNVSGNLVDFIKLCYEHNLTRGEGISWKRQK